MDFYREGGPKDVSGWLGPATIVSLEWLWKGIIGVKYLASPMNVKAANVRRFLHCFAMLTCEKPPATPLRHILGKDK